MMSAVFIVLISAAIWMAIIYVEKQAKFNIHKSLITVLDITQESLQRWSNDQQQDLVHIANDSETLKITNTLLQRNSADERLNLNHDFQQLMSKKMIRYGDRNFWLIDINGINIASKINADLGKQNLISHLMPLEFKQLVSGRNVFIPPINYPIPFSLDQTFNTVSMNVEPTAFVGTPIFNDSGKVTATLVVGFDPMVHFTRITELGRIGKTGETYAFDKSGLLITKSRFTQNLKLLGMLGDHNMAMLSIRITDPGVNLASGLKPTLSAEDRPLTLMAERALKGDENPYYDSYRDYRGANVFGAWLWNSNLGIGLVTEIDETEALETYYVTCFIFLCILGVIILLTVGLAFLPMWFKERERAALKLHKDSLERTVRDRTEQLEQANHKLKILSELDSLTRIANRRLYNHTLIKEIAMAHRTSEPLSLLVIDIDYFKHYNDNYGHDFGDIILQEVAQIIIKSLTRTTDFVARYGGEEFVAIMPVTNKKGATLVAQKIRENIENAALEHLYSDVAPVITVSVGIATLEGGKLNKEDLFKQADHALYIAKGNGRNQTMSYSS